MQDELDSPLTAKGMAGLSEQVVSDFLQLPLMTEKDHPTLPVKIGEPDTEAREIVRLVQGVMNETGNILLKHGKRCLGEWVSDKLTETIPVTASERASYLVKALVDTFPAFRDEGDVKGHHVKVYKKAQLLTFIIGVEFQGRTGLPFSLPATNTITATVDNVVPSEATLSFSSYKY
jgi:hypothetical protein